MSVQLTLTKDDLGTIETSIPARLDRLPWSRWHWRILIGLGTVWILDGLEVTIVGSIAGAISAKGSGIDISSAAGGGLGGIDVCGGSVLRRAAVRATHRHVRTQAAVHDHTRCLPRGDDGNRVRLDPVVLPRVPVRDRHGHRWRVQRDQLGDRRADPGGSSRTDRYSHQRHLLGGAAAGALLSVAALHIFSPLLQWRVCFGLGFVLGLAILMVRRHVPESPRWLFIHGREDEAEAITDDIERQVVESTGEQLTDPDPDEVIRIHQRRSIPLWEITRAIVRTYPTRTILGLALFIGQAFLYNAILFGYATLLSTFFGVATSNAPYYLVAFAVGNLLGPVILGPLFDSVGRKPMISGTYILSGGLLLITGYLFDQHQLTAATLTIAWSVVFFFASAGVSAAYLTVSEIFPLETRALAIAIFYAVGTGIGGIIGPQLFGRLIPTGKTSDVFTALVIGAVLMIIGGLAEIAFGVKAERRGLESIAKPLSAVAGAATAGDR